MNERDLVVKLLPGSRIHSTAATARFNRTATAFFPIIPAATNHLEAIPGNLRGVSLLTFLVRPFPGL